MTQDPASAKGEPQPSPRQRKIRALIAATDRTVFETAEALAGLLLRCGVSLIVTTDSPFVWDVWELNVKFGDEAELVASYRARPDWAEHMGLTLSSGTARLTEPDGTFSVDISRLFLPLLRALALRDQRFPSRPYGIPTGSGN